MDGTPKALREQTERVMAALRRTPGTRDVRPAWGERAPSLRLVLDEERVAQLGLSPQAIAQAVQSLLSGAAATQLREGERLVDVVLRAPASERHTLGDLGDLTVITAAGPVALAQVARLEPVMEESILWRCNREPFLTVRAEIMPGVQAPDITARAAPRIDALRAEMPIGMRIETGGATEESAKANASLFALFPALFPAIIAVNLLNLMVQQRHFGRTTLVVATAPLGIPGTAATLLVVPAFNSLALPRRWAVQEPSIVPKAPRNFIRQPQTVK